MQPVGEERSVSRTAAAPQLLMLWDLRAFSTSKLPPYVAPLKPSMGTWCPPLCGPADCSREVWGLVASEPSPGLSRGHHGT